MGTHHACNKSLLILAQQHWPFLRSNKSNQSHLLVENLGAHTQMLTLAMLLMAYFSCETADQNLLADY